MNKSNILFRIREIISRLSTKTITSILFLIALVCMSLLGVPSEQISLGYKDILAVVAFLLLGILGIVMIFRQEANFGIITFSGPLAIFIGIILMILSFFLATLPVVARFH